MLRGCPAVAIYLFNKNGIYFDFNSEIFFTFFSQVYLEIPDFKDRTVKEEQMASKDDLDLMVNRVREERKDQPDPLGPPDSRVNGDHKVNEDSC